MEQAASTDRGGPNSIFIYWFGVWGLINSKATGSQSVGSQEAFNSSSHVSLILGKYHQMPLTMNTLEAFAGVCYCHAEMSVWIDMNSMSHPANIEYPHYGTPKWMDFNTAGFQGVQDYKAAINSNFNAINRIQEFNKIVGSFIHQILIFNNEPNQHYVDVHQQNVFSSWRQQYLPAKKWFCDLINKWFYQKVGSTNQSSSDVNGQRDFFGWGCSKVPELTIAI